VNRGIIIVLVGIIALGLLALYALQQGPVLLLRPPPDDRIAFISDRGGAADIWTMRADGTDARQVTNDSAQDQIPAWSPDGKEIVSISDRNGQVYQVFISAWDGRYTHCITSSEGTKDAPVWSRDGKEISFVSGGKVYGVLRTGGPEEQYLPAVGSVGVELPGRTTYVYAAWSPDGKSLLYVQETDQGRQAYVADRSAVESGEEFKPTGITAARGLSAAWSPSDNRVAGAFIDRANDNGIVVVDLEAVKAEDLFARKNSRLGPGNIVWSPDGKTIAFEMWTVEDGIPNRSVGIYTVSASGGEPRPVVKGDVREPSWSPDGRQIAYTAIGKKEMRDIHRVNADGTGDVNLTNGRGDNYSPAWCPVPRKGT